MDPLKNIEDVSIIEFLKYVVDNHVSDVFIVAGLPLTYKLNGRQVRTDMERGFSPSQTLSFIRRIYMQANRDFDYFWQYKVETHDDQSFEYLDANTDDDFSFAIFGVGRFRANVFKQRGSLAAVIRVIPFGIPAPESMNIPTSLVDQLASFSKGLVLVTGPAAAGKTTTLACIIDKINRTKERHIITMEDPIEYVHRHDKSIVSQREIPDDVGTYSEALHSALRESPDVLLLGEMRDQETISTAMTAAEMAQLLYSTLHTMSAAATVDRIVDTFPASQQQQIRLQLSTVLQAIVCQQLVPTIKGGIVPVFEVMYSTPAIANLIREAKTHQMDTVIASGANGMRTMDQSLYELVKRDIISKEVALSHAMHEAALEKRFSSDGI